jgi:NurA-like 5'-3' nuclease
MLVFLVYYEPSCSKFIHHIVSCMSAGNFYITKFTSKFSPRLSNISVFHMGDIQKYTLL